MSGVIDNNGQQWEHCTACSKYVRIDDLGFLKPGLSPAFPHGADLCIQCVVADDALVQMVIPARTWKPVYEGAAA